jgi:predicted metal-dependent hydrolase
MHTDLREAVDLFNRRDYFASQERFERAWHETEEADRPLVQALVQLSVALHLHFHRGGGRGRNNLLQQCLLRLDDYRPARLDIDVQSLYDEITVYLEELKQSDVRGPRLFERWRVPKIKTVG